MKLVGADAALTLVESGHATVTTSSCARIAGRCRPFAVVDAFSSARGAAPIQPLRPRLELLWQSIPQQEVFR